MIQTKLLQLSYRVKKTNNDKSVLQKEDPYNRLGNCSEGEGKNKTKHQTLSNQNKSVSGNKFSKRWQ